MSTPIDKPFKHIDAELKSNINIDNFKKDVEQKGKKLYKTFGTEESMYYGAGIKILGEMEKKFEDIIKKYGFDDISKKLSLDGKVQVENCKNKFEETAKEFKKTIDGSWGFGITTSSEKMILKVSQSIIGASSQLIHDVNSEYEQYMENKQIQHTTKIESSKIAEANGIGSDNIFTEESNKLTIHQIIDSSKFSDNDIFMLDYNNCSNEKIKNKVKVISSDGIVYIERKNINGVDTFVYKGTEQRALVWKGIKMTPATQTMIDQELQAKGQDYIKNKTLQKEQERQNQMGLLENYKALGINFKNGIKISESQDKEISNQLYSFIESELDRLIIGALNGVSVPEKSNSPFVGAMTSGKLLVFETIRGQSDQYILRKDELQKILGDEMGKKVYDFLDKSENEAILKNFLNNRWNELYQQRITKNKNFSIDAKEEGIYIKDGKTYKKNDNGVEEEVKLDENQVFIDGLDIDWGSPENAVWMRNQIESEMDKIVGKINSGQIVMPKNANPFNTNRNFGSNGANNSTDHYIEFEKKGSARDEKVFEFNVFRGKEDVVRNIFIKMYNTIKVKDYMNKLWRDKYTNLVKEKQGITDLSKIDNPVELDSQISIYLAGVLDTYNKNNRPNEQQKAELRIKINEIAIGLKKLRDLVQAMDQLDPNKKTINDNLTVFGAKLAEITSGIGGDLTGIADADKLESALAKSEAEKNIQIAIENIDYEIHGKSAQELLDLYVDKHKNINNNYSKIDGFKQNAPAYMNALGTKIFHKIKESDLVIDKKRETLFDLAQVARDQSDKININNKFIDYDLSEEIFNELMIGEDGIINKLNPNDAIKPEHKESMDMSTDQRKSLFEKFPGGDQIAKQKWIDQPYKDLSIEQRNMLATYKNYFDRFGDIDQDKLQADPTYVNLIAQQLVDMTTLTSKFMMDDYSDKLDSKMKDLQWNTNISTDSNSGIMFPGLNDFDSKIAREYIDMKGVGYFNMTDRNTQKFKEYSAMAAVLVAAIAATVVSCGTAGPALAGAISSIATKIGITITAAAAQMASLGIIGGVVGSAVMIGGEFVQGKAYETWNEGMVDTATMTALFVGTSIATMGVGNFLNKIPSGLSRIYKTSTTWQKIVSSKSLQTGIKTVETTGSGAFMGYVENQRQEWLTGESHPEMVIQMMGLAMGMRVIMSNGGALLKKFIGQGQGKEVAAKNEKLINELEAGLKDTKDPKAKAEVQNQLNQARANQKNIQSARIKELNTEIGKMSKEIQKLRNEGKINEANHLKGQRDRLMVERDGLLPKQSNTSIEQKIEIKPDQSARIKELNTEIGKMSKEIQKLRNEGKINEANHLKGQRDRLMVERDGLLPKQSKKDLSVIISRSEIVSYPPNQPFKPIPNMDIKFPYWFLPIFLLPLEDQNRKNVLTNIGDKIDEMLEDPSKGGVELDTDITGPYDSRLSAEEQTLVKSGIDATFENIIKENDISYPLETNSLIMLRGVASWTYRGTGSGATYNEALATTRAEEFKKYLMEKYPQLTDDNFIIGSFHKADEPVDTDPQRFQGVTMSVVDKSKYNISAELPSGQDGAVV